jgi:hypothetical protein
MGESYEDCLLSVVVVIVGLACFCPSVAEARKALKGGLGEGCSPSASSPGAYSSTIQYSYSTVVQVQAAGCIAGAWGLRLGLAQGLALALARVHWPLLPGIR